MKIKRFYIKGKHAASTANRISVAAAQQIVLGRLPQLDWILFVHLDASWLLACL
jgi:hypothetical protein